MAQGPLDHPSYLTRQMLAFPNTSTAGSATLQYNSQGFSFPFDVRVRNAVAVVQALGAAGHAAVFFSTGTTVEYPTQAVSNGIGAVAGTQTNTVTNTTTTTLGSIAMGTTAAGVALQSGDMNFKLPAGQALLIKNGTSASGTYNLAIEWHIDPVTASWTGSN